MVTTACNTNCIYCYAKRSKKLSMPLQKIERIIDECHKIGVSNIALTGGDIFARKDWKELLGYTLNKGYYPFLSTKTPLTEDDVKLLKGIGIDKMQFSLDSIDGGIIQVMVGGSKAYVEKVKKMFLYCQQNGVSLNVRSVITIHNGTVENFKELYDFLSQFENIIDWVITDSIGESVPL
nr:radical SAM protein [uncultured Prevotella sp.]